jgi:hypothetical protein
MRTTLIVITAFIVVPFFVFRTTKTHVIVHFYRSPTTLVVGHFLADFSQETFFFKKISIFAKKKINFLKIEFSLQFFRKFSCLGQFEFLLLGSRKSLAGVAVS